MRRCDGPSTPARRISSRGTAAIRPSPATLRPMNPDAILAPVSALVGQAVFGAA